MEASATTSPLDDVEYLSRSPHRVRALSALARRPRSRAELRSVMGVSASTVRRTIRAFEARQWVHRWGGQYEVTALGAFVATGMAELLDKLETEQRLRGVWDLLPTEADGFAVWMWADAVVTVAASEDPYRPVNRLKSLLGSASEVRIVGTGLAVLEPCLSELCRLATDGVSVEIIDTPTVVEQLSESDPEQVARAAGNGTLVVRRHSDLPPHGFGVFGDRVAVVGTDPESGTVRVSLDTDAPTARDWVASRLDAYREAGPPLTP